MCTDTSQEEIHEARAQYVIDTVRSADDLLIVEQSGRAAAVIISLESTGASRHGARSAPNDTPGCWNAIRIAR